MRVSPAHSLALDPSIVLLDGPFGAFNEITRERLNDELLRMFLPHRCAALAALVRRPGHHPLGGRSGVPVHFGWW